MNAEVLLELEDADLAPPGRREPILRGVSLRILRGDVAVVMGKNGSGKSTLFRSLAGLWPVRRGQKRPQAPSGFDMRRVGLTLEDPPSQLVAGRVGREVEFGLENLGLWPDQIVPRRDLMLELFGLVSRIDRAAHTLSPGEQEHVLLAATLAPAPPVLLLDDPFLYLGPRESREAWGRLKALVGSQALGALVLATHDADLGLTSTRAGILAEGRLHAWGEPGKVVEDALRGALL